MKRIVKFSGFILLILFAGYSTTQAQDQDEGQLWLVWEATLHPGEVSKFIDLQVEFRDHFRKTGFPYSISAWYGGNFDYYIFYPVKSYDDKDGIWEALWKAVDSWGDEKLAEMWTTVKSHRTYFIASLPEVSYMPEERRLKSGEIKYAVWDMFYLIPGKGQEFHKLMKEFNEHSRNNNIKERYQAITGDIGFEGSTVIVVLYGTDPADFWKHNMEMNHLLGEEVSEIFKKMMKLVDRRDFKQFWFSKELSYTPEE